MSSASFSPAGLDGIADYLHSLPVVRPISSFLDSLADSLDPGSAAGKRKTVISAFPTNSDSKVIRGRRAANEEELTASVLKRKCPFASEFLNCFHARQDKKNALKLARKAKRHCDNFKDSFFTVKPGTMQEHITAVHSEAAEQASKDLGRAIKMLEFDFPPNEEEKGWFSSMSAQSED